VPEKKERPLSANDEMVFAILQEAQKQYEKYLDLTSLTPNQILEEEPEAPIPSLDFPLTLVMKKSP